MQTCMRATNTLLEKKVLPSVITKNPSLTNKQKFKKICHLMKSKPLEDILKPNSPTLPRMAKLLESMTTVRKFRTANNRLRTHFGDDYQRIHASLLKHSNDPELLKLGTFEKFSPVQYAYFIKLLRSTIANKKLTKLQIRNRLYRIITRETDIFYGMKGHSVFVLPDDIHQWFFYNIPKEESFKHYYFLIKKRIHLSASPNVWNFTKRLLQGSELELQLATFQIFLHDESSQEIFRKNFVDLYDFNAMVQVFNKLLQKGDYRFVTFYLIALIEKLEKSNSRRRMTIQSRSIAFLKFNNALMHCISRIGDLKLFSLVFKFQLAYLEQTNVIHENPKILNLLNKPLHDFLRILRKKGLHNELFQTILKIQEMPTTKSYMFKKYVIGELISSVSSFNDPKLTCQYVLSVPNPKSLAMTLNKLGLWGCIFHSSSKILSEDDVTMQLNSIPRVLSSTMCIKEEHNIHFLTELYKVLLATNHTVLDKEKYKEFLLFLYHNYLTVLKEGGLTWMLDSRILYVLLYHVREHLKDDFLSYQLLKTFLNSPVSKKMKISGTACPFTLVLYDNYAIQQQDISDLLTSMNEHGMPISFNFCVSMVFRYLDWNNKGEAYKWYQKIVYGNFEIRHRRLIEAIKSNKWEFPKHFNRELLETPDDNEPNFDGIDDIRRTELLLENEDDDGRKEEEEIGEVKTIIEMLSAIKK
ncbi:hypothetical protein NCAS_0F03170 [Naumovozyma castellii]|uniref:Mitochondrial translation factor ATP22 n=1 Tax=Naumovozyma castellii TaxID=27288 RepID=G0VH29_NAUCA|nr:hypothetical protein NCAS_0F03170 [Naumovozyma castellii CBS 4309]CCC70801.1 hypothetical protein NCAS_0F03170 [Naumovozyma castellii CBS 4309]